MDSGNKDLELRFKEFLGKLSAEKRNALFAKLKSLPPQQREAAIAKLLSAYEENMRRNAVKRPQQAPAPQGQRPQPKPSPRPQDNKENVQPHRPEGEVKAKQVPPKERTSVQPQKPVSKPKPEREEQIREARKNTEIRKNVPKPEEIISGQGRRPDLKRDPKPSDDTPTEKDFSASDFNGGGETPSEEKEQVKKNTVRDIIIVVAILAVFAAVCFGLKFFVLDKATGNKNTPETTPETSISETSVPTSVSETSETTAETTEPSPTPTPEPTHVPLKDEHPDLTGMVIVLDPGHQAIVTDGTEMVAPWLNTEKPRSTQGTTGVVTGIHEYELTLEYAVLIKDYLEQCGATVLLTRDTNDVDISNQERAKFAVDNNANLFLRIHTDAANDSLSSGVKVFVPSNGDYTGDNESRGNSLGEKIAEALGLEFLGTKATDLYAGLNYANMIRSYQVSLGLLSNSDDEAALTDPSKQVEVCAAFAEFASEFKES